MSDISKYPILEKKSKTLYLNSKSTSQSSKEGLQPPSSYNSSSIPIQSCDSHNKSSYPKQTSPPKQSSPPRSTFNSDFTHYSSRKSSSPTSSPSSSSPSSSPSPSPPHSPSYPRKNIPEKHSVPLQPKKSSSRFSSDWGKKGEGGFPFVSKTHRDKKNFAYPVETKPETVKKIYTKPEHQDKKESFLEKSFPKTTENYTVNTKILTKTPNIPEISTKRELIPKGESEFISGDIFTRQRSTSKGESEFISEETSISEDKISNESLQILSKSEDSEIDSLKSIDEIKSLQILEKNDILNKLEDSTTDDKVSHHPLSMMWKMSSGLYSPKFDGSAKSLTLFDHQFPKDKIESKEISIDELKNVILSGKFKFNENPKSIELVYHIWTQQNTIVDNMFELINTSSNSGSNQTGLRQSILPSNCFAKK